MYFPRVFQFTLSKGEIENIYTWNNIFLCRVNIFDILAYVIPLLKDGLSMYGARWVLEILGDTL